MIRGELGLSAESEGLMLIAQEVGGNDTSGDTISNPITWRLPQGCCAHLTREMSARIGHHFGGFGIVGERYLFQELHTMIIEERQC